MCGASLARLAGGVPPDPRHPPCASLAGVSAADRASIICFGLDTYLQCRPYVRVGDAAPLSCCAGEVAEARAGYDPSKVPGYGNDDQQALAIARRLTSDERAAHGLWIDATHACMALLKENWHAVEALAQAILAAPARGLAKRQTVRGPNIYRLVMPMLPNAPKPTIP